MRKFSIPDRRAAIRHPQVILDGGEEILLTGEFHREFDRLATARSDHPRNAVAMTDYIVNFYNVERRHSYLGNISPTEFDTVWASHAVPQLAYLRRAATDRPWSGVP